MKKLKSKLKEMIEKSPLFETLAFSCSVILSGILAGAFVNELTVNSKIQWKNAFKIVPTYLILIYLAVHYYYNKFLYNERMEIIDYKNDDDLLAYTRKELMPDMIDSWRKDIHKGNQPDFNKFYELINFKSNINNQNRDKRQDNIRKEKVETEILVTEKFAKEFSRLEETNEPIFRRLYYAVVQLEHGVYKNVRKISNNENIFVYRIDDIYRIYYAVEKNKDNREFILLLDIVKKTRYKNDYSQDVIKELNDYKDNSLN